VFVKIQLLSKMIFRLPLLVLSTSFLYAFQAQALTPTKTTVLLTAFEPFKGQSVNNSTIVARMIEKEQSQLGADVKVQVCILPIEYDDAAKAAENCYNQMNPKPTIVLSMGEGGCHLTIETRPLNKTDSELDNFGRTAGGPLIDPNGPQTMGFDLPLYQMYCALSLSERDYVDISNDMGAYVCDNTAFKLSEFFTKKNQRSYQNAVSIFEKYRVQYGFIHVQPPECGQLVENFPRHNADYIIKMLRAAINARRVSKMKDQYSNCPESDAMPIDVQQIDNLEKALFSKGAPTCDLNFLKQLRLDYSNPAPALVPETR